MRSLYSTKRRIAAAVLSIGLVAGVATSAYAYFTSSGSGTGSASVGSASTWKVTVTSNAAHALYPGSGSNSLTYTVTNQSTGLQELNSVTASVANDGSGNVTQGGAAVVGCLASWFTATNNGSTNGVTPGGPSGELASGASDVGTVTVTMLDAAVSQNACQGITGPDVKVVAA
ncbi:MAG: hypothetical protein ACYDD6_08955 [Acidimicrobiales bacterium]